mmetsp:Transcript_26676/g.31319  ORF Transcript_26676/g.31319 Transcript_26676/m.31319 type:complete len:224 (-) Transcript_26676:669-1340(-)
MHTLNIAELGVFVWNLHRHDFAHLGVLGTTLMLQRDNIFLRVHERLLVSDVGLAREEGDLAEQFCFKALDGLLAARVVHFNVDLNLLTWGEARLLEPNRDFSCRRSHAESATDLHGQLISELLLALHLQVLRGELAVGVGHIGQDGRVCAQDRHIGALCRESHGGCGHHLCLEEELLRCVALTNLDHDRLLHFIRQFDLEGVLVHAAVLSAILELDKLVLHID